MRKKIKDLKEKKIQVKFGPISDPEKFKIDLLEEAKKRLSINEEEFFNELELEIGDRFEKKPYPDTDRARMPPTYLCEGSVWVNLYAPDDRYANVSLVPHLDRSTIPPHHNFWLYWTDFDGTKDSDPRIPGHFIPINEPIVISITCDKETRKGTIDFRQT